MDRINRKAYRITRGGIAIVTYAKELKNHHREIITPNNFTLSVTPAYIILLSIVTVHTCHFLHLPSNTLTISPPLSICPPSAPTYQYLYHCLYPFFPLSIYIHPLPQPFVHSPKLVHN